MRSSLAARRAPVYAVVVASPAVRSLRAVAIAAALIAPAAAIGACDRAPEPSGQAVPGRVVDPAKPWSRADLHAGPAVSGAASAAAPDPLALADLLRAVPSSAPAPTDPDGGTLIGTDTGAASTASPMSKYVEPAKEPNIRVGSPEVVTKISSPAIEREARAQLYYPLVTKCRDKDGKILPPEVVDIQFKIDADGHIPPESISAIARGDAYKAAADCMRRTLEGLSFHGPAGALGLHTKVKMPMPSVD